MSQIVLIHGGTTFETEEDYQAYLDEKLVEFEKFDTWSGRYIDEALDEYDVVKPSMPLKENARYKDWETYFERHIPYLEDGVILIGFSLGGVFLAKFLSEHEMPVTVSKLFLVAAPYDDTLDGEDLTNGFVLDPSHDFTLLENSCDDVFLYYSSDDDLVTVDHGRKFEERIDTCELRVFDNKTSHFIVRDFPELVEAVKR